MLFGDCIKENLADCNVDLSVELISQGNCGEPLYAAFGKVTLFAFNEAGILADQYTTDAVPADSPLIFPLSLPEGNYTLIAWTNYSGSPFSIENMIKGRTSLHDLYMPSYGLRNGNKIAANTPMFTGTLKQTHLQNGTTHKLQLQEITKPLQITFVGLPAQHKYQARISFNAVHFKFENSLLSLLADDHYTMASLRQTEAQDTYTTETSLLWPIVRYNPQLIIRDLDQGADVFKGDLKLMLAQLSQVNFDCEPVIEIDLSMDQDYPARVGIVINGWKVHYTDNEL